MCACMCTHAHVQYFTQTWFLITAVSFGNKYCIWISQMVVPLEPSWRVQKSALGHDSYFTLAVYACIYMHAFQGKAVQQCVNDPYMCVHALAYVCVTCARACGCYRWITLEWSGVTTADYSSNVWMCIQYVCVCVVIILLCNVIHRVWMIISGRSGNTASVLEELCLYGERGRGFWKNRK